LPTLSEGTDVDMSITEAPTPPKGVRLPRAHKIVARLALVDNEGGPKGHVIRCSCGRWIEADPLGRTSSGRARALADMFWANHIAEDRDGIEEA
jgi:hypothetical protein